MNRRLDPLALPGETHARFWMLALAVVFAAWGLSYLTLASWSAATDVALLHRSQEILQPMEGWDLGDPPVGIVPGTRALVLKFLADRWWRAGLPIVAAALVLLGAYALYRRHPRTIRQRYPSRPIDPRRHPRLAASLRSWAVGLGLSAEVSFEFRPGFRGEGVAFGLKGREALILDGDPDDLERWSELTAPIAAHELAHLAERDTFPREAARALWVVLAAVVVPALAVLVAHGRPPSLLVRFGLLLAVVHLLWGRLIQVRELTADRRVAILGLGPALRGVLALADRDTPWWELSSPWRRCEIRWGGSPSWRCLADGLHALWRALWCLHPDHRTRRRALDDPTAAFRVDAEIALSTGFLLGLIAAVGGPAILELLTVAGAAGDLAMLTLVEQLASTGAGVDAVAAVWVMAGLARWVPLAALLVAAIGALTFAATRTLGLHVARAAAVGEEGRPERSLRTRTLLWLSFLTAVGFEAASWLDPAAVLVPPRLPGLLALPLWFATFTALLWLWLIHSRLLSRLLLTTHAGGSLPRWRARLVTLSPAVLALGLVWPAVLLRLTLRLAGEPLPAFLFPQGDPAEAFFYLFVLTTVYLLMASTVFYVLWIWFTLIVFGLRLIFLRPSCPNCGRGSRRRIAVGRSCDHCGEPLAAWLYLPGDRAGAA